MLFFFTLLAPEEVTSLDVKPIDNNQISVTCRHGVYSNGPEKTLKYTATLFNGGAKPKTLNSTECEFLFKDLSYSTNYSVEVCIILIVGFTRLLYLYSLFCSNAIIPDEGFCGVSR